MSKSQWPIKTVNYKFHWEKVDIGSLWKGNILAEPLMMWGSQFRDEWGKTIQNAPKRRLMLYEREQVIECNAGSEGTVGTNQFMLGSVGRF